MEWVYRGGICLLVVMAHIQGRQGNVCLDQRTCGACTAAAPYCGWCMQEDFTRRMGRCDVMENLESVCELTNIIKPYLTMDTLMYNTCIQCSGSGSRHVCGGCTCNNEFYGPTCECNNTSIKIHNNNEASCRRTNTSELCEAHGQCVCGQCICFPISQADPSRRWTGELCGCNNYNCPYFEGQICGGIQRGTCDCGKCHCSADYTGNQCQCPKSTESCRSSNGMICNGKGTCECGRCNCNMDSYYRGQTCEECPVCPGKCYDHKACALCIAFNSGELTQEYCSQNCRHVSVVDVVEGVPHVKMCMFRDEDNCEYFFTYEYETGHVNVQRTKHCPDGNVLANEGAVVAGIISMVIVVTLCGVLFRP